jgi:hypothetical protein
MDKTQRLIDGMRLSANPDVIGRAALMPTADEALPVAMARIRELEDHAIKRAGVLMQMEDRIRELEAKSMADFLRDGPQPLTEAQLEAVAAEYQAFMEARGHSIGPGEYATIVRAARIQDAWRVAFAKVLK